MPTTKTDPEAQVAEAAMQTFSKSPNDFESVLAEYGITAPDVYIPKPPMATKQNLDQLCEIKTSLADEHGNDIRHDGHTGPMMFLAKKNEVDGDAYEGYDGFYIYEFLHPVKGKTVVTIGRPEGEDKPNVVRYLDSLHPGALFCVAAIPTRSGFRTFQPVPVQVSS